MPVKLINVTRELKWESLRGGILYIRKVMLSNPNTKITVMNSMWLTPMSLEKD